MNARCKDNILNYKINKFITIMHEERFICGGFCGALPQGFLVCRIAFNGGTTSNSRTEFFYDSLQIGFNLHAYTNECKKPPHIGKFLSG